MHRFASAAAAPIFLNLSMMATLALAAFFRARVTRRWASLLAGVLEFLLLAGDAAGLASCRNSLLSNSMKTCARSFGRWGLRPSARWNADRAVRRHHHRDLFAGRRAFGAVLRRPSQPVADRRDRDRDRHRAVAGNVAGASPRTMSTGASAAQRRAFEFSLLFSVPFVRRLPDRADVIMRAIVCARRVLEGGCRSRGATLALTRSD